VLLALEERQMLSTFTVNSLADDGSTGTLRWAVAQADVDTSPSTIDFDLGAAPATITLSMGALVLSNTSEPVAIDGPGAGLLSISGNHSSQVFAVEWGADATLSGMTITGGSSYYNYGGGLNNWGTAALTDCVVSGNSGQGYNSAAGVGNQGTLTVYDSTISGNNAAWGTAGLRNSGTATLTDCTISGNSTFVGNNAGGVANYSSLMMTGCTISGNASDQSGGMVNWGTATLINSTIADNLAKTSVGGGVDNNGNLTLTACTVADNAAQNGGGIWAGEGVATLTDTIVAGNTDASGSSDIASGYYYSSTVDGSYNLIGPGGSGDIVDGTDGNIVLASLSGLGVTPLGDYGGPTETMALLPSSPAVGAGTAVPGITTDQRGLPLNSPVPDIGAYQTQPVPPVFPTSPFIVTSTADDGVGTLRWAVEWANLYATPSEIDFDLGSAPATITLTGGSLDLSNSLAPITINGPGAGLLTISGDDSDRVFDLEPNVTASLSGLTITGGSSTYLGGGLYNLGTATLTDCVITRNFSSDFYLGGGGLVNKGTLTLVGCTISNNYATTGFDTSGAGMINDGMAWLTDCTITGNTSRYGDGAGMNNSGTATLTDCTISDNAITIGDDEGGGIANTGMLTMTGCTISGNSADGAGGLANFGTAILTNCTIAANSASYGGGGGVYDDNTLTLTACTISGNFARSSGGGLWEAFGTTTLTNTIIAGNFFAGGSSDIIGDESGDVTGTYNLIGTGGSGGIQDGIDGNIVLTSLADLRLTPLADLGGPTQTMALLPGSAAIGTGTAVAGLDTDQRGLPLDSPVPDIGAFQTQPTPPVFPSSPFIVTSTADNLTPGTLRWAVAWADLEASPSEIEFDLGTAPATIALTQGQLELSNASGPITIDGPGADLLTIDRSYYSMGSRVFQVDPGVTALFSGLTVSGGQTDGNGGALYNDEGTATLTDCTITGNYAVEGGGLMNLGSMNLIDCTINGNYAYLGAGLYNGDGTASLYASTIAENDATTSGGGVYNLGTLALADTTISGNSAQQGGGLLNLGDATLAFCTVASNSASVELGGIYNAGSATLNDTIVASNRVGSFDSDIGGPNAGAVTGTFNLIGSGGSGSIQDGVDGNVVLTDLLGLQLAPLGNYGGPTETMALYAGSLAIGAGTEFGGITTDQRGLPLDTPVPDIGAYQTQPGQPLYPTSPFEVTSTSDDGSTGTLRWAVYWADQATSPSTIDFSLGYGASTITLTHGPLELSNAEEPTTIIGPGYYAVTITADDASGVFRVDPGVTASFSWLKLTGGSAAIGGGLYDLGNVTLTDCTISGNSAAVKGGGIFVGYPSSLTLSYSTISGNTAELGGGLYNYNLATLTNCTISGNSATEGGGIFNYGTATLTSCTISGNSAQGGGLYNFTSSGYVSTATLTNTIVAGNTDSANNPDDIGGNLSDDVTGSYDLIGTGGSGGIQGGVQGNIVLTSLANLGLAPLGNYGGPTQTMALYFDSVAVGAGTEVPGIYYDQRGYSLDYPLPDIGAFQNQPYSPIIPPFPTFVVTSTADDGSVGTLRWALEYASYSTTASTIEFDLGSTPATITLTDGTLYIDGNAPITIDGPGADMLTIRPEYGTVFYSYSAALVTLSGLTISGGYGYYGGGVDDYGNMAIDACVITDNSAYYYGGGIYVSNNASLTIIDSTINDNSSEFEGGGLSSIGDLTLTNCTISGNSASRGGGIFSAGPAAVTSCTISGNIGEGGGLYQYSGSYRPSVATLTNTIVAGNTEYTLTPDDIRENSIGASVGAVTGTYNLIGTGGSGGIQDGVEGNIVLTSLAGLGLAPLANYGGPTPTMALYVGSEAIGAGTTVPGITTDQRGYPLNSLVPDIGAFQSQPGQPIYPPVLIVSNAADDGSVGTLRWAVDLDDQLPIPVPIDIELGSAPATITLLQGPLVLSNTAGSIAIYDGPGEGLVTVSGNDASRVFQVDYGVAASISGLTITEGSATSGGGIGNYGTLFLTDCTIEGNSAQLDGGGLFNDDSGSVAEVIDCTISGNTAGGSGGGVFTYSPSFSMKGTTLSSNSASKGAGLYNYYLMTLIDCTISGNSAQEGGGLYSNGTATVAACTISGNTASIGGGLYDNAPSFYTSVVSLVDTIVAGNTDGSSNPSDIGGMQDGNVTGFYSLIGTGGSGGVADGVDGNIVLTDLDGLGLSPLGDYGGPTQTIALLPGSLAIGAGIINSGITTDQRGMPLDAPDPDIGAFQTQPALLVNTTIDGLGSPSGDLSLRQAVNLANVLDAAETIAFDSTVFATPQTITLTLGQLELSDTGGLQTIEGPAAALTITADDVSRDFQIDPGVTATLSGLTITGGSTSETGGGVVNNGTIALYGTTVSGNTAKYGGGGLSNYGTATLTDCTISGNSAWDDGGGGLQSDGTITLTGCTITGNTGDTSGGLQSNGMATITDSTFTDNLGKYGIGGAVYSRGTTIISDTTISGNSARNSAGGLITFGTTTITGSTIDGNTSQYGGGLWSDGTTIIADSTISGNSAGLGGGLIDEGSMTITDSTISDNTSSGNGGGVWTGYPSMFSITGSTISGNTAARGGGLYIENTAILTNCTISGNSASEGGGLFNYGTATLTACTVSGNSGVGGGLYNYFGPYLYTSVATLTDTIVAGNTDSASNPDDIGGDVAGDVTGTYNLIGTGGSGGIVGGVGGNIVLTDLDGLGLSPLGNYGGPTQTIALMPGSLALGAGTAVAGITTDQRGMPLDSPVPDIGAFQTQPVLLVNTTIDSTVTPLGVLSLRQAVNLADVLDSAETIAFDPSVFATPQTITLTLGQLELSDTGGMQTIEGPAAGLTITANDASRDFQIDPGVTATLSGLTITGGSAYIRGGGIYNVGGTLDLSDCTIAGNTASFAGGGLDNNWTATATITDCTFSGNSAILGGGLVNDGEALLNDCTITGNTANYRGGGMYNGGIATATVDDCSIDNNFARYGDGGGIWNPGALTVNNGSMAGNAAYAGGGLGSTGTATITGCTISGNSVSNRGGGLYNIGGTLDLASSTIAGNSAGFVGGGLDNNWTASATITDCTFTGNSAFLAGGLVNDGEGTLETCTISGNTSFNNGGGLYNGGIATGKLYDCTIDDNISRYDQGGGIWNPGTLTVTGGTIDGNSAAYGGGLATNGTATLTDVTISGNSAEFAGGGISNGNQDTITDCTISGNSAGVFGGGVSSGGDETITGSTISGNSAGYDGGGVSSGGQETITGCTISGNSAESDGGGVSNGGEETISQSTISGNSAMSDGGGVSNGGTVMITQSTISGNSALVDGGGVSNGGTATITTSTICGNSATDGGGLANFNTATLTNCTVSGNSAQGGGLYDASDSVATLTNTIVAGNTDSTNNPDDIGGDAAGEVTGTNNLVGTGGSGGLAAAGHNLLNVANPLLSPLGYYGGPTETIALLPGSLAIGTGVAVAGLTTDQRGVLLPSIGIDIGAFQSQGFTITIVSGGSQSATVGTAFSHALTVLVTANDPLEPVAGGVVCFAAPSTGASAVLSSHTATIGANGMTSITATANGTVGGYSVTATARGVASPASFALTNNPAPPVNVTSDLSVKLGGFVYNRTTRQFSQTVTIKNTSGAAIVGPISLLFLNLENATPVGQTGTYQGSPYITVLSSGSLGVGQSLTFTLVFVDPTLAAISYTSEFFSGAM
jgi:fibronectin-binding autotransporter adhesin